MIAPWGMRRIQGERTVGVGNRIRRVVSVGGSAAIFVALIGGSLAGCGGGTGEASPSSSATVSGGGQTAETPKPSPTIYVPASSKAPAQNVPVPEKPALADEFTNEGWKAFVLYFFDQMNYLVETNRYEGVQKYTTAKCQFCLDEMSVANAMQEYGQWRVGGKFAVTDAGTDGTPDQNGYIGGIVQFSQADATPYDKQGSFSVRPGIKPSAWYMTLGKGDNGWVVISIDEIKK